MSNVKKSNLTSVLIDQFSKVRKMLFKLTFRNPLKVTEFRVIWQYRTQYKIMKVPQYAYYNNDN